MGSGRGGLPALGPRIKIPYLPVSRIFSENIKKKKGGIEAITS
jgi:hypothetical protein